MTEKEYNDCVNLYADNVYRFIVKNLRHEEDARDVVQTAFEKLWRNRDEVDNDRCKSYLFTVAYNGMIDHLRKVKRVYAERGVPGRNQNIRPAAQQHERNSGKSSCQIKRNPAIAGIAERL
jgi:RNA polymerase sigma factor (sigma-70 family)